MALRENLALSLEIMAEQVEARAEVERLWDNLAATATVETVDLFYDGLLAGTKEISQRHSSNAAQLSIQSLERILDTEQLLAPEAEAMAAVAINDEMLDILYARYQGGLDVDTDRRLLLGQVPASIAETRVLDLQDALPPGVISVYKASRNAFATEAENNVASMSSIVRYNGMALNGVT